MKVATVAGFGQRHHHVADIPPAYWLGHDFLNHFAMHIR